MAGDEAAAVSHGRGGAANINPDDTKYVDGEITRQGEAGSHGDGPFSTGRGGSANIANADKGAAATRADKQVVPDAAVRPSDENKDYHTGRGGAGNAHLAAKADEVPIGLADKLKNKVLGIFRK